MAGSKEFVGKAQGMTVNPPSENAKSFIACTLRLYPEQLIEWLAKKHEGDAENPVKVDVKIYSGPNENAGPLYLEVNNFRPEPKGDDKPF
jgi:hypothetical protein